MSRRALYTASCGWVCIMCVGRGEAPSEPRCRLVNHFLYLLLDPRKAENNSGISI